MKSGFTIPLATLVEKTKDDIHTVARKATLQLFSSVVAMSPVDSGRFKANWNVSYGTPDLSVTGSTVTARADEEAAKALTLPIGGVMYLSNGLPYGRRLEYEGWSKQAPAGMVRVSAARFADYVNGLA